MIARGVLGSAGSRYIVLLRKERGSELNSDWLFIIRWVNPINVTATRIPTEKPRNCMYKVELLDINMPFKFMLFLCCCPILGS